MSNPSVSAAARPTGVFPANAISERAGKRPVIRAPERADRLPPHSEEAEKGVLGCILLDPSTTIDVCMEQLRAGGTEFYDLRHQTIYTELAKLREDGLPLDIIHLQKKCKDKGLLVQIGG